MKPLTSAREALILEALGEVAGLIQQVEGLGAKFDASRTGLVDQLTAFEERIMGLTNMAAIQAGQLILERTEEAARGSIEQQRQAMADAARAAIGNEVGVTLQRLQAALRSLTVRQERIWEQVLTHLAAAALTSAATWTFALTHLTR